MNYVINLLRRQMNGKFNTITFNDRHYVTQWDDEQKIPKRLQSPISVQTKKLHRHARLAATILLSKYTI